MNLPAMSIVILACLGQGEPGTVAVVDGDLAVVTFELSGGTPYRVDYPSNLENVWLDRAMTAPAVPLTTYIAYSKGDVNDDGLLDGKDVDCFVYLMGPQSSNQPCESAPADFNDDGLVDMADILGFVEALLGGYPPEGVVLYVEGTSPSTALGDAAIDLLTDPDWDLTFTVAQTQLLTVVALTIGPLSGPLGTPITITMTPAISPLAFDATTRASWRGAFQPMIGDPSDPFSIAYSAAQFREASAGEAVLIAGDGRVTSLPDLALLEGPGTTEGVITLNLGGLTLKHPLDFAPETDAAKWEQVEYPDGPGGLDAPRLYGEAEVINAWLLSLLPDPAPPESSMLLAGGFHHAAVVRISENPDTVAAAPDVVSVDLVSYDQAGAELDRVDDVPLNKVLGDDGEPANIVYHNDLYKPIILVDVDLDKGDYPNVFLLRIEVGGTVVVVPAAG